MRINHDLLENKIGAGLRLWRRGHRGRHRDRRRRQGRRVDSRQVTKVAMGVYDMGIDEAAASIRQLDIVPAGSVAADTLDQRRVAIKQVADDGVERRIASAHIGIDRGHDAGPWGLP